MRNNFLFAIMLFICLAGNILAQAPNWLWAKSMGNSGAFNVCSGTASAIDSSGNLYTTGSFDGTVDFDPGPGVFLLSGGGAFITKLDSSGNFIWAKALTGNAQGRSIAINDSGFVYMAGSFTGMVDFDPGAGIYNLSPVYWADIFFSKYDSAGNFIWVHGIGGQGFDYCTFIIIDNSGSGDIFITGSFGNETIDFDPGPGTTLLTAAGNYCLFISRFSSSGNLIWAKAAEGYNSWGNQMAMDPSGSGDIYITGGFNFTVDFDPDTGVFDLTSVGVILPIAPSDIFVAKFGSVGNFLWAKQMGGPDYDEALSLAIDVSGNVYTTGYFANSADFDPGTGTYNITSTGGDDIFISKLDGSGNFVWAKTIGGMEYDYGTSITVDLLGSYDIYFTGTFMDIVDFDPGAGSFNLTSAGDDDIFISKFDSSGNFVWAKSALGLSIDHSSSIILDPSDNAYLTGYFGSDTLTFGSILLTNPPFGNHFLFIAKIGLATNTGNMEMAPFAKNVLLFPNPANESFTIGLGNINEKVEVEIRNIVGKLIYSATAIDAQNIEVITKHFTGGTYLVQIKSAEFLLTRKLIVTK